MRSFWRYLCRHEDRPMFLLSSSVEKKNIKCRYVAPFYSFALVPNMRPASLWFTNLSPPRAVTLPSSMASSSSMNSQSLSFSHCRLEAVAVGVSEGDELSVPRHDLFAVVSDGLWTLELHCLCLHGHANIYLLCDWECDLPSWNLFLQKQNRDKNSSDLWVCYMAQGKHHPKNVFHRVWHIRATQGEGHRAVRMLVPAACIPDLILKSPKGGF